MTFNEKQKLITEIVTLLQAKLAVDTANDGNGNNLNIKDKPAPQTVEMLTIKECASTVKGLSEHTVRQLVAQGKIPAVRAGAGKNGKILISKAALTDYFNSLSSDRRAV
jgi:excisionase family DNA binding protein